MMTRQLPWSLEFETFALEFFLDVPRSVQLGESIPASDPSFTFAVAEVWLAEAGGRWQLSETSHPGNMLEDLRHIAEQLGDPLELKASVPISAGGWCQWMRDYRKRVDDDKATPDDERSFDDLIVHSLLDSRPGSLACYMIDGVAFVEASPGSAAEPDGVRSRWCSYTPGTVHERVMTLRSKMERLVRSYTSAKGF